MATSNRPLPGFNSAIRIIAQREIKDTLSDWRILLPIFILTFILPQLIVTALVASAPWIGRESAAQLVPFAMLLVGFIPASFSLITALEAFVGERERNSLEALLAMPISDADLYSGKLLSSLLPPLLSSYLAMAIFGITMAITQPALYFGVMNLPRLLIVLLLIGAKSVVMVAGAVIISSHTSSIRAANLLASFVLIPMSVMLQLEALLIIGERWDTMSWTALALVTVAVILARTGMQAFNREEILSREHEQFNFQALRRTFLTFFREYRPAGTPLEAYARLPFSPARFYRAELPALLRELHLPIAVALLASLAGLLVGFGLSASGYGHRLLSEPLRQAIGSAPDPGFELALRVFLQNSRVVLLSSLLSTLVFGVFAFLVPAVAFAQIGYVSHWLVSHGGSPWTFLAAYVLPHGIVELPVAMLGAAMGLRIGAALVSHPPGFSVGQNLLWALANFLKLFLLLLLPLLGVSALIEGLLTPLVIRALY
jgi:uncharacterized membrane protein SpoIIM required for sporulation/ABC-type transport system involved in multi-copper enzyme maturation permease subunit